MPDLTPLKNQSDRREAFLIDLIKFGNLPYIWGGDGEPGFDCSGLVQRIYSLINLDPPGDQTAQGIYDYFKDNGTTVSYPELGDCVFFGKSLTEITHVALGLGQGLILESGGGGSSTRTEADAKQRNAKVRVRQVSARPDAVAYIRPNGLPWRPAAGVAPIIPSS